ncbi:DUF397 domain-containing protein [Nocardiopsis sp. NPDC006139]|uniref:DUF397 domain-containing protein n=1 Tax=Nocardiopsis sp. NPDC006139 TaxID=3154578 RepID=UPI0033BB13D6
MAEPTPHWYTSSYSADAGHCVEVAHLAEGPLVRDSQNRTASMLAFPSGEWSALMRSTRD